MIKQLAKAFGGVILALGLFGQAQAIVINFDGATGTNSLTYEEGGFRIQSIGGTSFFGDYYGNGNNVIHSHWSPTFGTVTRIVVSKIDGSAFDLNYFVLTSNTDTGGSTANGTEQAFIHASGTTDGSTSDYTQQLPAEDWGFPANQIFLGSQFDNIKSFWFDVTNDVDCFGMDSFYINEAAPGTVPEPGSFALAGLAMLALGLARRRRNT